MINIIILFRPQQISQVAQPPSTVSEPQPASEDDSAKVKSEKK